MTDILAEYMSKRLGDVDLKNLKTKPGPVVTLSRAAGCLSQRLARELAVRLNKETNKHKWEVLSKEILNASANQLQLHPKKLKSVFKASDRSVLDDIVQAFMSAEYHLQHKMRKTVITVIKQFAIDGHKIILGRAGNIICAEIEQALHVRINAPIDWKIEHIMKSKKMNKEEAVKYIEATEKFRKDFRHSIKKNKMCCEDFDLTINQSKFSNTEIIEIIVASLKSKKII